MAGGSEKHLGKYLLRSQLGQGGMGVVYLAHDTRLRRDVALKILPRQLAAHANSVARFFQEARVVARLNHPNVVVVHDVDQERGYCFLVMELLTGGTMQERMGHGFSWGEATEVIAQACRGLAAAHDAGLIHRDIKPSNIMRSANGTVKLTDFGLAKITEDASGASPLTRSNTIVGTPQYMSPEQCRGETLDARSDVYSLGATYFALLAGQPPYADVQPLQVMFAHCSKPAPDPRAFKPEVPSGCAEIVMRAMAKNRADRFGSANDMLAALSRQLTALPTVAIQAEISPNSNRPGATAAPTVLYHADSAPAIRPKPNLLLPIAGKRVLLASLAAAAFVMMMLAAWIFFGNGRAAHTQADPVPLDLAFAGQLPGINASVRSVAFAADGKSLFTAEMDGALRQWDVTRPQVLRTFTGTRQSLMAVTANERWLAAGGEARTVWLWRIGSDRPHSTLPDLGGTVSALAISPNGKRLAVGGYSEVRLYELDDNGARLLKVLGTSATQPVTCYMVMSVAFSPDGRWLAATTWTNKQVIVWDAVTGALKGTSGELPDNPMAVAFLPQSNRLLIGLQHQGLMSWDLTAGPAQSVRSSAHVEVRSLAATPDGHTAAVVGEWGGSIRLFNLKRDEAPRVVSKSTSTSALATAFDSHASQLVTCGGDEQGNGYVHLWRVERGKP